MDTVGNVVGQCIAAFSGEPSDIDACHGIRVGRYAVEQLGVAFASGGHHYDGRQKYDSENVHEPVFISVVRALRLCGAWLHGCYRRKSHS